MLTSNFESRSEDKIDIIYNVVFFLPTKFDRITEVIEENDGCLDEEIVIHKPPSYNVINNSGVEEKKLEFP